MRYSHAVLLALCFSLSLASTACFGQQQFPQAAVPAPQPAQQQVIQQQQAPAPQPAAAQQVATGQMQAAPTQAQPQAAVNAAPAPDAPGQADEHPLMPALRWAHSGYDQINKNIRDYTCTMVKRERINGKLGEHEYMFAKVRHEPFSVYLYFMGPDSVKGQECIYIEGQNDGNMLAHAGSGLRAKIGTVSLKPTSVLAMQGNRYPITELGVKNLTKRLIEVAESDTKYGECEVKYFKDAKVNGVNTTCIQVVHPIPRRNFMFYMARVFVDTEQNLPIRYEAYEWPTSPGGEPVLIEEYTYVNLKLNPGLTDADFDRNNPNYKF